MRLGPRVYVLAFAFTAAVASLCRIVEFDTPWYVAAGQLIARTRSLPLLDPFSYTSTRPWLNHEWLSELFLAAGFRIGGFEALSWLVAILVGLTTFVIVGRRVLEGIGPLLWPLLVFVLREASSPRAQLFSTLLFAITLALVLRDNDKRDNKLWWCVPIQLVWTQLHGGDPVGVAALGLLFVSGPSLRRALVVAACALATICGPYGFAVHQHFLHAHAALPMIREWAPLSDAWRAKAPGPWVATVLIVVGWIAVKRARLHVLLLLVFTIVAVRYVRFTTEAAIVAAAVAKCDFTRGAIQLRSAIAASLLALLLAFGSARVPTAGLARGRFPEDAVEWLAQNHPPGPMLNSYNFGGYLLWAWPEQRVFVDGRAFTVYDESVVAALPSIYDDPTRFSALAAKYGFRLAVLQRTGRGATFATWLATQPGWHVAHQDDVAVVLTRTN